MHEYASGGQRFEPGALHALLERSKLVVVPYGVCDPQTCGALVGDRERNRFGAHRLPDAPCEVLADALKLELENAHREVVEVLEVLKVLKVRTATPRGPRAPGGPFFPLAPAAFPAALFLGARPSTARLLGAAARPSCARFLSPWRRLLRRRTCGSRRASGRRSAARHGARRCGSRATGHSRCGHGSTGRSSPAHASPARSSASRSCGAGASADR